VRGQSINPRGSIGLGLRPGIGPLQTAAELIATADAAMYQSKRRADGAPRSSPTTRTEVHCRRRRMSPAIQQWFEKSGDKLPGQLWTELDSLTQRLNP
jgi:GGDEF domain-containing protein